MGGARGFAHIGVLKVLTQAGIGCDVITGTSMGALVGAVYAAGGIEKLEEASNKIKLVDIPMLLTPTWPSQGLFSGRKVLSRLNEFIGAENIEDLEKPFAAICVDINSSEIVAVTKGNLNQAVRASIAIPGIFTPVRVEDRLLVDGGACEPLPVQANRLLGADFVIAVDLLSNSSAQGTDRQTKEASAGSSLPSDTDTVSNYIHSTSEAPSAKRFGFGGKDRRYEMGIVEIIQKTSILIQQRMTTYRLKEHPPDFIIRPAVSHLGILDFHRGKPTVEIGEKAAKAILPSLIEEINKKLRER